MPRSIDVAPHAAVLMTCWSALAGELMVVGISPGPNEVGVPAERPIVVTFDRQVFRPSINGATFKAFGRWSGLASGGFSFDDHDQIVTFTPDASFSAGEPVMVVLSHSVMGIDGSSLRPEGYAARFWTATRPACLVFVELDVMSNRDQSNDHTQIYGALGADLNHDGWLDITTVNEVSADLRVFLNAADGSGTFGAWLEPPAAALPQVSPSEPADFNGDGLTDICVASDVADAVLVFLGNGDGTLQAARHVRVGSGPRGIAVLDADGDGDFDIVNSNNGQGDLSLLLNDGAANFAAPLFFDAGVDLEFGVAVADMDNDAIMDLVVGGIDNMEVAVLKGTGNATFTLIEVQDAGGFVRQLGTGDLNGDGWEDVHTANSFSQSGSILLNLGGGQLGTPLIEGGVGHAPATDLGDFDGDGDLDWLLSSFGGGFWRLLINDSNGNFSISEDFAAPNSPSCGTAMDLDNDGDLDMALLDEIADFVILMENVVAPGDTNCDGGVDVADLLNVIGDWGPCTTPALCPTDIEPIGGNGVVNVADLLAVIANWG